MQWNKAQFNILPKLMVTFFWQESGYLYKKQGQKFSLVAELLKVP